jgi:hypothetical protein
MSYMAVLVYYQMLLSFDYTYKQVNSLMVFTCLADFLLGLLFDPKNGGDMFP